MRSGVPATFQQPTREIKARLYTWNDKPVFENVAVNEDMDFYSYADGIYNGKLLRVGINRNSLPWRFHYQYTAPGESGWLNPVWTEVALPPPPAFYGGGVSVSIAGNSVFCSIGGDVYRCIFNGTGLTAWAPFITGMLSIWSNLSITAVSATELYILERQPLTSYFEAPLLVHYCNGSLETMLIAQEKRFIYPDALSVVRVGSVDWGYLSDETGKKPISFFRDGHMSAHQQILPIDRVDDESGLQLAGATVINNQVLLTGILTRRYGRKYAVMMVGPENVTTGRDYILAETDKPGRLYRFGDDVWYVGPGIRLQAQITPLFGAAAQTVEVEELSSIGVSMGVSQPWKLSVNSSASNAVQSGDRLELKISANGAEFSQGLYGVDEVSERLAQDGQEQHLQATSLAMKQLADWRCDTYYDLYSQAHLYTNASDLAKVIRQVGKWGEENGKFGLLDRSTDGFLYLTPSASEGGILKLKIVRQVGAAVGLGSAYGEETLAEAADRLGKKIEEVKANERMRFGIFAVYLPGGEYGTGRDILRLYNHTSTAQVHPGGGDDANFTYSEPWQEISMFASTAITPLADGASLWLMLRFQQGHATVYYRPDGNALWTKAVSYHTVATDAYNLSHRFYGRGAIYAANASPTYLAYAFNTDASIVPVNTYYKDINEKYGYKRIMELEYPYFPSSGVVQVDSEQIAYTGMGGNLPFVAGHYRYGKVVAAITGDVNNPSGSLVEFARTRNNNYAIQTFAVGATSWTAAVKVWLKKVGDPEDGVEVSLWTGSPDDPNPLGQTMLTQGSITAAKISANGSAVVIPLDKAVQIEPGMEYWFVISRAKNPTHPNTSSYFQFKLQPGGYGYQSHVFEEIGDDWLPQGHAMAFQVIGKVDEPGGKAAVVTTYNAEMLTGSNDYTNGALVVDEGSGKGTCLRIISSRRDDSAGVCIFYVDPPPGRIFDETSRVRITYALTGLTRGHNNTLVAAHRDGTYVQYYESVPIIGLSELEYYTCDEDRTLFEVAEEIARKAGVLEVVSENLYPSPITPNTNGVVLNRKNMIARLGMGTLTDGKYIDLVAREGSGQYALLRLIRSGTVYSVQYHLSGVLKESIPLDVPIQGQIRFSVFNDRFSLWINRRLWASFKLPELPGDGFRVSGTYTGSVSVFVPEAHTRVDNFGFDMGRSGLQLIAKLVGQKRVFCQDDGEGRLRVFIERPLANSAGSPERRIIEANLGDSQVGAATRLMLEGGEVIEVSDAANLKERGNYFNQVSVNEINSLLDAEYFAGIMLEDAALNYAPARLILPADPTYEPGDEIFVALPGQTKRCVIDSIDQGLYISTDDIDYGATIAGRMRP